MKKKIIAIMLILSIVLGSGFIPSKVTVKAKGNYMTRYKRIEKKCKRLCKYDGTQYDMNMDSSKEFKIWDKELKKVYKKQLQKLNKKKTEKLKKLENKWKKKRIKYAEKGAKECIGGSMYPLVYNSCKISYTKKRIKWLVKKYGDVGDF